MEWRNGDGGERDRGKKNKTETGDGIPLEGIQQPCTTDPAAPCKGGPLLASNDNDGSPFYADIISTIGEGASGYPGGIPPFHLKVSSHEPDA